MVSSSIIQVRLTKEQKQRAILNMQNAGKNSMSDFVRELVLGKGLIETKMLTELYKTIVLGNDGKSKNLLQGRK